MNQDITCTLKICTYIMYQQKPKQVTEAFAKHVQKNGKPDMVWLCPHPNLMLNCNPVLEVGPGGK